MVSKKQQQIHGTEICVYEEICLIACSLAELSVCLFS